MKGRKPRLSRHSLFVGFDHAKPCASVTTTSCAACPWKSSHWISQTSLTPARKPRPGWQGDGPRNDSVCALRADGKPARFVVLGLGKLGGTELNYSSDIDLVFLYDEDGRTSGPRVVSNAEFFTRMGAEIVRLLAEHTSQGVAYRVDMRLRPDGEQGTLARSLAATLGYYETRGRTWERQALIKCRPVAGDLELGATFVAAITPFIYRRYLGGSEIAEIKALEAKDRAAHGFGGGRRIRGQDGPRRNSRRRIRGSVSPIAARRRVPRGSQRQYVTGNSPARGRRLPNLR